MFTSYLCIRISFQPPDKPVPQPPQQPPQQVQQQQQQQQSQEKQQQQQQHQQLQQQQQQQQKKDSNSKVVVLERKTGRILTGPTAPTESGLKEWLTEHPTFEVLQPSQAVHKSSSFYSEFFFCSASGNFWNANTNSFSHLILTHNNVN